jgi:hypothetical protein
MAHFAKVVDGIVTQVNVVDEQYFNENRETRYTGTWIQTDRKSTRLNSSHMPVGN